ncbi:MAG: glutamate--tRNA ligase [Alphaproteobacteria bacterium]
MSSVVTRFAPSPTGFLHIGGARTALFNWLYARHHGGRMLLRIEDTDRKRSTDEAVAAILAGLQWLGIDWDGEPVHQFSRVERHREIVDGLLAAGRAYRCYASPDELAAMREKARADGRSASYDRRWRDRDPSEAPADFQPSIRIKMPTGGSTVVPDLVQGNVSFAHDDLDDFVIMRSDGTPTYMLAVVVDDHDMDVTHIIRGDDHLTNAARQTLLYKALDWPVPTMAHISLIHGSDGAKLSKRHGALGVEAYQAMGYLPQAMRNYLVRLGWSHGDDEIMSLADMIAWFDADGIGKAAARFDFAKLESLNAHYLKASSNAEVKAAIASLLPLLPDGAYLAEQLEGPHGPRFNAALPFLRERAKTLVDLLARAQFVFDERPLSVAPDAAALLTDDARTLLSELNARLATIDSWNGDTIEATLRTFAADKTLKLGKIAQPLRAALTGRTSSPGIFDVLAILGRSECLARIEDQANTA